MDRLRWQFNMVKHKLGWLGLMGIIGLAFVVVYFFTVFVQTQQLLVDTQQALLKAKAQQATDISSTLTGQLNPFRKMQLFTASFPTNESINKTWEQLANLADKSGLKIDQTHYAPSQDKHAGLLRYQLNMPAKATYPQLRAFLAEVIQSTPNVALEQLSLKRDVVDASLLEANIGLVLYSRAE